MTATIGRTTSFDEVIVLLMAVAPSHNVADSLDDVDDDGIGCDDGRLIGCSVGWYIGAFADHCGAGVGKVLPCRIELCAL